MYGEQHAPRKEDTVYLAEAQTSDKRTIRYNTDGKAIQDLPGMDIVDMVDTSLGEGVPSGTSVPEKQPELKLEIGHAYTNRNGARYVIESRSGEKFYSGLNGWYENGHIWRGVFQCPEDLIKDLGKVDMETYRNNVNAKPDDVIRAAPKPEQGQEDPGDSQEVAYVKSLAKEEALDRGDDNVEDSRPLPNEELIQAVLQNKTVQWKRHGNHDWEDLRNRAFAIRMLASYGDPVGAGLAQFRLKPTIVVLWGLACKNKVGTWVSTGYRDPEQARTYANTQQGASTTSKLLRLEIDDDLNVVSASTEAL